MISFIIGVAALFVSLLAESLLSDGAPRRAGPEAGMPGGQDPRWSQPAPPGE